MPVLLVQESWHMPAVCVLHLRGVLFRLLPVMGQPLQEWRKHCQCVDELELEWLKYQERSSPPSGKPGAESPNHE